MVSTIAFAALLAKGSPQYYSIQNVAQSIWNVYESNRRSIEAPDELWVWVVNHKSQLPELSKEIKDAPNKLRSLDPYKSIQWRGLDVEIAVPLLAQCVRITHLGNVTDDLVATYNEARKTNNRQLVVQAFERYREELNLPTINTNARRYIWETRSKGEQSVIFKYEFDPVHSSYLSDLKENFGVKVFHSDLPKFRISYVTPESLASQSGLQAGDEILKINGRSEADPFQKLARLSRVRKSEIWIQIKKMNGSTRTITVRVPGF